MMKRTQLEEVAVCSAKRNRHRNLLLAVACWTVLATPAALAQAGTPSPAASSPTTGATASTAPAFDVATIRPHTGVTRMVGAWFTPEGLNGSAATVAMLMQTAYGLRAAIQVAGGPDWARSERYDVEAKMTADDIAAMKDLSRADKQARSQQMLQALLAERFKLKAHSEIRQVPVYELVVAKGGTKIRDAATDTTELRKGRDGKPFTGIHETSATTSEIQGYSMKALADYLTAIAFANDRPVVDKTGLTGTYNFTLNWSIYARSARPAPEGGASDPADEGTFLSTALKEVGLDLHPAKGGIEYIVIDHIEKPTEN